MLVFVEGGKQENPEKNPRSKARTNNKPNPHMGLAGNRTRATSLGGERFHLCVIPASQINIFVIRLSFFPQSFYDNRIEYLLEWYDVLLSFLESSGRDNRTGKPPTWKDRVPADRSNSESFRS